MEENIKEVKDFFAEFKDRVTSPLFGSFVISWLFFNWRVPITLIFYKREDLYYDVKVSFIDAINDYCNWFDSFIFPLIAAILYTFLYPFFRNFIKEYQAARLVEVESRILKKSNLGHVSIARHQVLNDQLRTRMEQLQKFYDEQTQIETDHADLVLQSIELVDRLKKAEITYADLDKKYNDLFTYNQQQHTIYQEKEMKIIELSGLSKIIEDRIAEIEHLTLQTQTYRAFIDEINHWLSDVAIDYQKYKLDDVIVSLRSRIFTFNETNQI